jgi:hypothetical protein
MIRTILSTLLLSLMLVQVGWSAPPQKISIPVEVPVNGDSIESCIESAHINLKLEDNRFSDGIIKACEAALHKADATVEKIVEAPHSSKPIKITLKVHGFLNSGNKSDYNFSTEVIAKKDLGNQYITAKGKYGLDGSDAEESTQQIDLSINDDVDLTDESVIFFYTHISHDEKKGENLRGEVLVGFGTTVWGDDYHGDEVVKASIGLGGKYLETEDGNSDTSALVSLRLKSKKKLSDRISIKHVVMVKLDPQESEDWEASNYLGFTLDQVLTEAGSINIGVENTYVNQPAAGKENSDTLFKVEFVYKW